MDTDRKCLIVPQLRNFRTQMQVRCVRFWFGEQIAFESVVLCNISKIESSSSNGLTSFVLCDACV